MRLNFYITTDHIIIYCIIKHLHEINFYFLLELEFYVHLSVDPTKLDLTISEDTLIIVQLKSLSHKKMFGSLPVIL
jgi:predicted metal-dependent TIM-barrel fold hydrolase